MYLLVCMEGNAGPMAFSITLYLIILKQGLTKLEVCSFVLVLLASELPSASQCWDYRHA